jgi:dihydrofolate reductase
MRNVILQMSISLDGVVAVPKEAGGLSAVPEDAELKRLKLDWLGQAGCHIMGRTTYLEMAAHWPHSDDAYAAPMNELPKVVFSQALQDAQWETSRIARGELVGEIDALRREPGGDIIAHGGAGFAHALLAAGMIDQYRLVINPVLAGQGLNIFRRFPGRSIFTSPARRRLGPALSSTSMTGRSGARRADLSPVNGRPRPTRPRSLMFLGQALALSRRCSSSWAASSTSL